MEANVQAHNSLHELLGRDVEDLHQGPARATNKQRSAICDYIVMKLEIDGHFDEQTK